jgi:hypothetical protein
MRGTGAQLDNYVYRCRRARDLLGGDATLYPPLAVCQCHGRSIQNTMEQVPRSLQQVGWSALGLVGLA